MRFRARLSGAAGQGGLKIDAHPTVPGPSMTRNRRYVPEQDERQYMDELDDACLTLVMRQLAPLDVFSLAATCRRCRDILWDKRLALMVSKRSRSSSSHHRHVYETLQAAVDDSRPGETIVLEPTIDGEPHAVSDVTLNWPLHIVGGGMTPGHTVLQCGEGAAAALDFCCSGKLANVTVRAARAACVRHRRGSLWLQQCSLECDAKGLDHLFSAIVTSASGVDDFQLPVDVKPLRPHRLTVVETAIQGGRSAIQTLGGGTLRHVRCIFREAVYFWFDVDAGEAAAEAEGDRAGTPPISLLEDVKAEPVIKVEPDVWQSVTGFIPAGPLAAAAAEFSATGLQHRGVKRKAEAVMDEAEAEALLDERARRWSVAHQLHA